MRHFRDCAAHLLVLALPIIASAQDESVVTAREHYQQVLSAAQGYTADAALIVVANGADVIGSGQAHNWRYYFRSTSRNEILLYVYEQDDESVRRVNLNSGDPPPLDLHVDMTPIPATWVDSDVALAEADANGGNDYRASANNNYHVEMVLLPPADGGRNALFHDAAWLVIYTGEPGDRQIPVDATTGTFLDFGKSTARRFLHEADSMGQYLADDLELLVVGTNIARPDGTSPAWTYYFRSPSESKFYAVIALEGRLVLFQQPIGESGILQMDMPTLPSNWLDSDVAVVEAEQEGGETFRQTHSEWQISANVGTWDTGLPEWQVDYNAPSESERFVVNAVVGNPATARERLDEILAMATPVYSDAELILVSSQRMDLDGLAMQWSYFFKSVSTPDIFELKVVAGEAMDEVYPFGMNGYLDIFMPALPYKWVDSDEGIVTAEQQGGTQFRQAHDNWKIVPELKFSEPDRVNLEWHFDYQSPTGAEVFKVDAVPGNPVTARQLLQEVVAAAQAELGESHLVQVSASRLDLEGRAKDWSYVFTEIGSANLAQVTVSNGEVLPELTPVPPDETLRLDMPALPDKWLDSDSALAIVEQTGGAEFRQSYPNAIISLVCSWQDRGPTVARNLGERPMYSVLYETQEGSRFRRGVDLTYGAYSSLATTTAQEPLAALEDSAVAAELPDDAVLVNILSTDVRETGYADHWMYLYESPAEERQYEFRALGGHIIRLDSVRTEVGQGLPPLPDDWIDSPLALKVSELDGGAQFRAEHPDYSIALNLRSGDAGVFWDVLYGYNGGAQRFTVDALDFSVHTKPIDLPRNDRVLQAYPNPFSSAATLMVTLPQPSDVSVTVYDLLGRKRVAVAPGWMPAGRHALRLDVPMLEAGAYFVVVETGEVVRRGQMVKVTR